MTPCRAHCSAFINARRNKLKLLVGEERLYRVVQASRAAQISLAAANAETVVTLTGEQLNWLLDGYDVWRMKPHEALHFSVFS